MAFDPPSGIFTRNTPALPLEKILASGACAGSIAKADLELGDTVLVATRNSVYALCALGGDLYAVSGGWFERYSTSPQTVAVNGCTWGGSVIKHDIVAAPGLFLEFGNGVKTTRIQSVRIVRAAGTGTTH